MNARAGTTIAAPITPNRAIVNFSTRLIMLLAFVEPGSGSVVGFQNTDERERVTHPASATGELVALVAVAEREPVGE